MIKCNKGEVKIEGEVGTILADLSTISEATKNAFNENDIPNPEKLIRNAVEKGLKSEKMHMNEKGTLKAINEILGAIKKELEG